MPERIEAHNIRFGFGAFQLLRNVSLTVDKGEVTVVAGRSGHGKSILLEICSSVRGPESGEVLWDGVPVYGMNKARLNAQRQKAGYMFQQHGLIANMGMFANIALPLRYHSDMDESDMNRHVRSLMDECGLYNIDRLFPEALATRQLRCASLARALVMTPEMLFLDEPTCGLDPETETNIVNILRAYHERTRATMLIASTSRALIEGLGARLAVLESGQLLTGPALSQMTENDLPFLSHYTRKV